MRTIQDLDPKALWRHFWDISQIPRESGREAGIREHISNHARRCGLVCRIDKAGNILVKKPGGTGAPPVALQSHMDMVCEKDKGTAHDFSTDPIRLVRDGDWIRADGTTLGADNGIGVAIMLAIMEDTSLKHPELELLFTVEEETGLTGANRLTRVSFSANTLLNLDSEDEGCFSIGCAGGMDTELVFGLRFEAVPENTKAMTLKITGLKGGHSGVDIHEGHGNAIKLLTRFLSAALPKYEFRLAEIQGGNKRNAIPREAEALIQVTEDGIKGLRKDAKTWTDVFRSEFDSIDDGIMIIVEKGAHPARRIIATRDADRILGILQALPHGPVKNDLRLGNAVVTSTNLAICACRNNSFVITTSQRSLLQSSLNDIASQVRSIGELTGCRVMHSNAYPAWKPNFASSVLKTCTKVYKEIYGKEPQVKVVHAGLECAVIGEKVTGLDMISLGPTIEHPHSPSERVHIDSVGRFWDYLTALLRHMAGQ
jgi:dipeptidase D